MLYKLQSTTSVAGGVQTGFWLWLGFIATSVGDYGFEGRSWKLYPIDRGWQLPSLLAMGAILAY